jgi:hypothetical protein
MASNNIVDFKVMPRGGLIIDSTGDIAFTTTSFEAIQSMVIARLKASLNAYQLYQIGADLDAIVGNTISAELETTVNKQVVQSLTNQFLPMGTFTVETITVGSIIQVYVYIQNTLVATTNITSS